MSTITPELPPLLQDNVPVFDQLLSFFGVKEVNAHLERSEASHQTVLAELQSRVDKLSVMPESTERRTLQAIAALACATGGRGVVAGESVLGIRLTADDISASLPELAFPLERRSGAFAASQTTWVKPQAVRLGYKPAASPVSTCDAYRPADNTAFSSGCLGITLETPRGDFTIVRRPPFMAHPTDKATHTDFFEAPDPNHRVRLNPVERPYYDPTRVDIKDIPFNHREGASNSFDSYVAAVVAAAHS